MGLDREPREEVSLKEPVVAQVYLHFCSLVAALEKPSLMPQWKRSGTGVERTGSRDPVVEEPRIVKVPIRNDCVQALGRLLDLGGAKRTCGRM